MHGPSAAKRPRKRRTEVNALDLAMWDMWLFCVSGGAEVCLEFFWMKRKRESIDNK